MSHISAWMGAGVVAAGVSAAMIVGADVASADAGTDASADSSASASGDDRTRPGSSRDTSAGDASEKASDADTGTDTGAADGDDTDGDDTDGDSGLGTRDDADARDDADPENDQADADAQDDVDHEKTGDGAHFEDDVDIEKAGDDTDLEEKSTSDASESDNDAVGSSAPPSIDPDVDNVPATGDGQVELPVIEAPVEAVSDGDDHATAAAVRAPNVVPAATSMAAAITTATVSSAAAAPQRSLQDIIASFIFDFVGVAVTFIAGPPVVPRGSTVTVKTSTLKIDDKHTVPAHWYYPDGDEPPQRIIYLQHGFLGVGAMYSYTAANLAERTNSIVVVPTLTSNRNVQDGFWLGSDQALRATSALFLGEREALTASAIAAGYAQRYGAGVSLPDRFALVGHSLGGNLVAGAAGYYADAIAAGGGAGKLAGVVLLDAAPQGSVLSDALVKLDGIGTYVPVLELGAPKDVRRVDAALNEHRPGKFNGIVLENGKHLDSMDGGTWLIQFISHLYQGFPTAQNQAAAQVLIGGWVNDILDGRIDPLTGRCGGVDCAGIYGDPGQTLELQTPAGPTRGQVIGTAVAVRSAEFQPAPVTATVSPRQPAGRNLMLDI
ncbi:dienelactone hydrolase family protein [Mycolicibacterium bacteremicum]|uniref:hypothetical protein n=1 Tax=Mycolicibacterium bacteremicum TaxID=564198 RepID=UPI0021F2639B|nr:hypothetical protein [Mycolicibacterium bacteremicum]MCV7434656.1 hypothetical protein [Mycolicibacterium bacteremicum]